MPQPAVAQGDGGPAFERVGPFDGHRCERRQHVIVMLGEDAADHQAPVRGREPSQIDGEFHEDRREDVRDHQVELPLEFAGRRRVDLDHGTVAHGVVTSRFDRRRCHVDRPHGTGSRHRRHDGDDPGATAHIEHAGTDAEVSACRSQGQHRRRMISESEGSPGLDGDGDHIVAECVLLPGGNDDEVVVDPHRPGELAPGVGGDVGHLDRRAWPPLPQCVDGAANRFGFVADSRPEFDPVGVPAFLDGTHTELPQAVGGQLHIGWRHRDHECQHQSRRRSPVRY
jgi:hypothetical protein